MNFAVLAAIVRKDLVDAIANRRILVSIVLPIGLSVFFGLLLQGLAGRGPPHLAPAEAQRSPMVIPVYDPGNCQLTRRLAGLPGYRVEQVDSLAALSARVETGGADAGLALPADLDAALAAGANPVITLVVDRDPGRGTWLAELVKGQLRELVGQELPVALVVEELPRPAPSPAQTNLPTWLALSLAIIGAAVVPTMLVEEKERWTLRAVVVTRATYVEVVAGKAIVGLIYALLAGVLILALNGGLGGHLAVSLGAMFLGGLALVQVGLLMGGLFDDLATVNAWSTVLALVLMLPGMLAGFPSAGLNLGLLGTILRIIPTTYVIEAVGVALLSEAGPASALPDLAVLAGLSAVLFASVILALRWREA